MAKWIRQVGDATFILHTQRSGSPRVEMAIESNKVLPGSNRGLVTVKILKGKKVFTKAIFNDFCNETNAKKMIDSYVMPLLKWII